MAGEGSDVLLFLHGFNGRLTMWDDVWPRLENCPVRRLRVDMPEPGGLGRAAAEAVLVDARDVGDLAELAAIGERATVATTDPMRDLRGELSLPGEPRGDSN